MLLVTLTADDVQKINQYDSESANYTVDPEMLSQMKMFSKSQKVFIGNVARKMFAMNERYKECNVSGLKNRGVLSPTKIRYQRICGYTSTHFNVPIDARLTSEVKRVIDDVNRKFRTELKRRKNDRVVQESRIVERENFD